LHRGVSGWGATRRTETSRIRRILGPHDDIGAYEQGTLALFTLADAMQCLGVYAGTQACTKADIFRLNVETTNAAFGLNNVVRLARNVAGLIAKP
jgi:hypothetical protein